MWLRTQKPMNRFPQEEGGRVAPSVLIHLGPWREIYELLYSAPMQGNCRIQQPILCAPSWSAINCCVESLTKHFFHTIWPYRYSVSAGTGASLKLHHTSVGERLFNGTVQSNKKNWYLMHHFMHKSSWYIWYLYKHIDFKNLNKVMSVY